MTNISMINLFFFYSILQKFDKKKNTCIMKSPSRNCIQLGSKNKSLSRDRQKSSNFSQHFPRQSQIIENGSDSRTLQSSFYRPQRSEIYNVDQQNSRIFYQSVNFHPQVYHSPQASRILKINQNINRSSPFSKQKKIVRLIHKQKQDEFSPVSKFDNLKIASNLSMNSHLKQNRVTTTQTVGMATQRQTELIRKLKIVEGRLQNLLKEKQNMQVSFTQQNRKLFHQNQIIKQRLKDMEQQESEKIKMRELQEMLEIEINKSLQLMDTTESQAAKIIQLEDQNQKLKNRSQMQLTQISTIIKENLTLKAEAISFQQQFQRQIDAIQETNDQIKLEFTNQTINLQYLLSQAQQVRIELQEKLKATIQNGQQLNNTVKFQKQQIDTLKQKLQALQQIQKSNILLSTSSQGFMKKGSQYRQQCKKCQQLLKTVFKLNSHLNKEAKQ